MEIVTGDRPAPVEHADAVRLLREMAAVVRTLFAVEASPAEVAPGSGGAAPGAPAAVSVPAGIPAVAAVPPAPALTSSPAPIAAGGPPASIPVPGVAILQEIAFLDDRP